MHNTKNTLHTPTPSSFYQRWSTRLWKFLLIFRSFQVKYAVKAAVATMILLIPAFVDLTRPYFVQYRGEWALISMLIVMVPTVGGTNIVGIYRIMGTLVGCLVGVVVYLLFPAHDIMLPICCLLFAIPNFYLVLISAYPRIGQVTLLAFNLVLLQTYNRRHGDGTLPPDDDDDDDDVKGNIPGAQKIVGLLGGTIVSDVWALALHRAVAVSLGVVCGVVVTSYVWPYEARVELRKGLSDLLLNISWLYNRLVSVYSTNLDRVSVIPQQERLDKSNSRLEKFLRRISFQGGTHEPTNQVPTEPGEINIEKMNKEFMAIELSLQLQLLELYALLAETPNEPRLKGKFPAGTYKMMLGSCQNILDRFLSMRLVITQDQWVESARRDFIIPVNKERREMVGNVLLYFYTIASALRLKTPLPPYLPPANHARMRLIKKIRLLPVVQNRAVMMDDNDDRYIFYYAYALVMDDVIRELERLGRWSQDLFGVITPAAEFEAWFTDDGQAPMTMPFEQLQSSATREAPMSPYRDVDEPYQYTDYHQQPISVASPSPSEPHVTYFASPEQHRSLSAGPTPRRQATESSPLLSGRHFDSEHDGKVSPINQDTLFYFDPLDTNADSNVNSSRHSGRDSMSIGTPVSTKSLNEYLRAPGSRLGRRVNSSQSLGPNRDLGVAQTWTERRPPNAPPPPRSYGSATQTRRHQSLAVRPSSSASVQSRNSTFVHTDTTGNVEGADARYPRDT
ncbi:hypothetical protein BGW38_005413 [Lunasporangiospora selenospora]|uniref:DUF2421 domain-containing protein n=1 Tax=Lunasporangiospora selenospora TaxID=979761 RepID=A0A9P6KAW3_9FUNG|nr:hypothetical protein BGW38_005413 [Lunasporangiospora selenospora]